MKKRGCYVFLLLFVNTICIAQAPKFSNEFLSIGIGARSLGMSSSVLTSVDDVTAAYWNPSRLNLMQGDRQLAAMHASYFAGIAKFDYAALGLKLRDSSALAFSAIRFGVDNIPNTSELIDAQGNIHYDRVSSFSATDFAFIASYSKQTKIPNLSIGGSAKIIRRTIGNFASSWGFGIDIGSFYKYNNWKFAAVARDVSTTFNAWSFNLNDQMKEVFALTGNEIPVNSTEITLPRLLIGVGRDIRISDSFVLVNELGVNITSDKKRNVLISTDLFSFDPHLGVELNYKNIIYLRTGIGNIQKETNLQNEKTSTFQVNVGLGIKIRENITIDYALSDLGNKSIALYSNIFSLRVSFNKRTETND